MFIKRIVTTTQMAWAERKGIPNPDLKEKEIEFLPSELELMHTPVSPAPRILVWSIIGIATCALVWSCFGKTDLVATASGKVVSAGHTKVIQPIATGTVKAILVHDGDHVKAGQSLIILDSTELSADQNRIFEQWQQARLTQLRSDAMLAALGSNQVLKFEIDSQLDQAAVRREETSANAQLTEYRAKLEGLKAQASQKLASAKENAAEIDKIKRTLPIIVQRVKDYQQLEADKFVSQHAVQDRQAQRIQMEGDLAALQEKASALSAAIVESKSQILGLEAEFKARLAKENADAANTVAQLAQELTKAKSQTGRSVLTSPVDGVVQQLAVHTVGGVVTPAQPLLQVVPVDESVIVEAWVENKDIGFVTPNQKAEIKVETFEHTKYGTIPATVLSVSSDAVSDEKKGLGYIARLQLQKSTMQVGNRTVHLGPGLAVTSEIKIGTKRIIEYVLSPMLEAASAAVPR